MKRILLATLKFLFWTLLLLVICALTFGLVIWRGWPWWIGFCFLLGYFALFLIWLLIRKILLRRREKYFVNEVIAQDEAMRKSMGGGEPAGTGDLQVQWKKAVETLQQSKLGKAGNPLYALPWYMVIGESRSGKTTAIRNCGLAAPFAEARQVSGLGGTRNCDWWFFEKAVILDTAGRYAIPLDEGRDRKEWEKFLSLLVRYRKKEALNGLVVTIAADKLLKEGRQAVEEDGLQIRQRLDELMRVLGLKIPVYVLVTKCDLVQGMAGFCGRLPEPVHKQVMGLLNRTLTTDAVGVAAAAVGSVRSRLSSLRLALFASETGTSVQSEAEDADLLLFPNEFSALENNLTAFIEAAFKENPYQETPVLRGIYFSSGKQEGMPYSSFLKELGLMARSSDLQPEEKSFFLHDLFARVMADDRELYSPTTKAVAWTRLTRNIGLTAWAALVLAFCGLVSFSFMKNLTTLRAAADAFTTPVTLQGEILGDTAVMDRFLEAVATVEEVNDSWWFPRFGLDESERVEAEIKEKYCNRYRQEFSIDFDKRLEYAVAEVSESTPDGEIADLAAHLTRRINLLLKRLSGKSVKQLREERAVSFQPFISSADSSLVSGIDGRIANQYLHYLGWQKEENLLRQELSVRQRQLRHLLTMPGASLNWLVSWANTEEGMETIGLEHFWGNGLVGKEDISVPPAFTAKGKASIDAFLIQMEQALSDPLVMTANKAKFDAWYDRAYLQVWYDFARKFPRAEQYLPDRTAWQQAASAMAGDDGPYFKLLDRLEEELGALEETDRDWIVLLGKIKRGRIEAEGERAIQDSKSVLAKVSKKGKKALSAIEKGIGSERTGEMLASGLATGGYFNSYRLALSEIVLATSSRDVSFTMASDIFSQDPAVSEAVMYKAQRNLIKLRNELTAPGDGKETLVVWKLVAGPLSFLRDYAFLESSCKLNALWEEEVLVEVQDVRDKTALNDQFFGRNGLALQFVSGTASPFLKRNLEKGFYPGQALGRMIPFRQEFLDFMTEGVRLSKYKPDLRISEDMPPAMVKKKEEKGIPPEPKLRDSYRVSLQANPTSVNKGAKMIPHAVTLEMNCGAEQTRLVNLQYPVRQEFVWKPRECDELSLKIELGSLMLAKEYGGEHSFATFVEEYQDGEQTYTPNDFPEKEKYLKRLNVRSITVKFRVLKGAEPLLRYLAQFRARNQALGLDEAGNKIGEEPNVAELLMSMEDRRREEELEYEALKRAWKKKQLERAAEIKRQWEAKLPNVPRDISICWD